MNRRRFLGTLAQASSAGVSALLASIPSRAQAGKSSKHQPFEQTLAQNAQLFAQMFATEQPLLRYEWIVIHHTAAEYATLEGIDRYHRQHFGDPLGAEYHFVINNGKKKPIGLIEAARWRYQEYAAHLFHPERAPHSCAICLIGNFEERKVPTKMLQCLADLTRVLMKQWSIGIDHVTTHRGVDKRLTQCPGKNFPFDQFIELLQKT